MCVSHSIPSGRKTQVSEKHTQACVKCVGPPSVAWPVSYILPKSKNQGPCSDPDSNACISTFDQCKISSLCQTIPLLILVIKASVNHK